PLASGKRLRGVAKALDRRTDDRLAQPLPPPRQGLGKPQSQRSRFPQTRFNPPHAPKAMQSLIKFPDGLLVIFHRLRQAGALWSFRLQTVKFAIRQTRGRKFSTFASKRFWRKR